MINNKLFGMIFNDFMIDNKCYHFPSCQKTIKYSLRNYKCQVIIISFIFHADY